MSNVIGLIGEGDSLTYVVRSYFYGYFGGSPANISAQVLRSEVRMFSANVIGANFAISGSRLDTPLSAQNPQGYLVTRAATNIDPLLPLSPAPLRQTGLPSTRPTRKSILSVMVGTNPGNHAGTDSNFTQTASELLAYFTARVAAGFNALIACTIPDRGDGIIVNFDTYRQGLNAIIRAWNNSTFGVPFACADFAGVSNFGGSGDCNNATYFADTIHPTIAGYALIQPTYNASVNSVISQL